MTTGQKLNERGINLNTLLIAISILGAIVTSVLFIAPLKTLPYAQERSKRSTRHRFHRQP